MEEGLGGGRGKERREQRGRKKGEEEGRNREEVGVEKTREMHLEEKGGKEGEAERVDL